MAMAHGESIYNILPPKEEVQPKPKMFKSKIPDWQPTASTFHAPNTTNPHTSNMAGDSVTKVVGDRGHADFGKMNGASANDPKSYMKKFARSSSVPSLKEMKKANPDALKPSHLKPSRFEGGGGPPKRDQIPVMNLVTSKNFIVSNAVEAILAAPKKTQDETKDYLKKEDYGKVPKYLTQIKKDIANEYDYIRQLQEQHYQENSPPVMPLEDQERRMLLDGLKAKWEVANQAYQGMTHMTVLESCGQKYRKESYEAELASLEKEIERMGKPNISVDLAR